MRGEYGQLQGSGVENLRGRWRGVKHTVCAGKGVQRCTKCLLGRHLQFLTLLGTRTNSFHHERE